MHVSAPILMQRLHHQVAAPGAGLPARTLSGTRACVGDLRASSSVCQGVLSNPCTHNGRHASKTGRVCCQQCCAYFKHNIAITVFMSSTIVACDPALTPTLNMSFYSVTIRHKYRDCFVPVTACTPPSSARKKDKDMPIIGDKHLDGGVGFML